MRLRVTPRAIKAVLGCIVIIVILCVAYSVVWEHRLSSHESWIAAKVIEKGGYVVRPARTVEEFVETATNYVDKPVLLGLAESTLARMTHDRLGVRVERAIFEPQATAEFAAILRQSNSLSTVQFPGEPSGPSTAPIPIVEALRGVSLQTVEFDRHKFKRQEIIQLSDKLNTRCIVFVLCTFPSDAINDLRHLKGLETVYIHKCKIEGSPQSVTSAVESLRSAGVDVSYQ